MAGPTTASNSGLNGRPLALEHAGGAVDSGIAAESEQRRVILDRIVPEESA